LPFARVIVDIPSRHLDREFDYAVPPALEPVEVGACVLVDFAGRPVVAYVVARPDDSPVAAGIKDIQAVLGGPLFDSTAVALAQWISTEYLCPLSEALRLFTPPGGTPRAHRSPSSESGWTLKMPGVGPVDDRWVVLTPKGEHHVVRPNATMQRAVIDALGAGPVRVAELTADLGAVDGALAALSKAGAVEVQHRRRLRTSEARHRPTPRHDSLTEGQRAALDAIEGALEAGGGVVLLDGVTGSGKTEVYLQAIEGVLGRDGTACVLVPEISLTPQTVGRFRARFGEAVAVLHSRLSPGERYDQWDLVRQGAAQIVVGARSALFSPLKNVRLIVIDEEHEPSYKQSSSPRYHARDVAVRLAQAHGAVVVLGSASPSMESLHRCEVGEWTRVVMGKRATGGSLPDVLVVDLGAEFTSGNKSMFSRELTSALEQVRDREEKAVLFLNRRGFASFLLCRECGYVPTCDSCSTSLTYHEIGSRLVCHHCGATRAVPPACPRCSSPYLRQFGAGTQRVESELRALLGEWPVVRMDADTTKGKGAHERRLAAFEALDSGVLLGTQMIAKGLDYPEVTLVGIISADVTLNLPDFRAAERTYQLLAQVAGRAGRGERPGRVVLQTYWPDHVAVRAAALHDPSLFYVPESEIRSALGYPPFGRLANIHIRGRDRSTVATRAHEVAAVIGDMLPSDWRLLGPSPSPLSRLKGVWRWHLLIKAPDNAPLPAVLGPALARVASNTSVSVVADIDPIDLL
jgi:primosomal protein N' (replication factor Y)